MAAQSGMVGRDVGRDRALPCLPSEGLSGMHIHPLEKTGGALERSELRLVASVSSHQGTWQPPGTGMVGNHRKFPVCSALAKQFSH